MPHAVRAQALPITIRNILIAQVPAAVRFSNRARSGTRSFRTSVTVQAQPDKGSASSKDGPVAGGLPGLNASGKGRPGDITQLSARSEETEQQYTEVLGAPGATVSSGRSRHAIGRSAEGVPPVDLPQWLFDDAVILYNPYDAAKERARRRELLLASGYLRVLWRSSASHDIVAERDSSNPDRTALQMLLKHMLDEVAWNDYTLQQSMRAVGDGDFSSAKIRSDITGLIAALYMASLSREDSVASLLQSLVPYTAKEFTAAYNDVRSCLKSDQPLNDFKMAWRLLMSGNAALELPLDEQVPYQELLAAVRSEFSVKPPSGKAVRDIRRPISIVSVLNYKGPRISRSLMDDLAEDIEADVIHLDAATIARVVGKYLGQTPYYARGPISMLGYSAAEMNGRLLTMGRSADMEDPDTQTLSLGKLYSAFGDDRWEEIKINRILEEITRAADSMRAAVGAASRAGGGVIIHIHDYVELVALHEGASIVNKLRAIVDRLWHKGRRIVLVGSTSTQITEASHRWREQLSEMAREDCYIIPFHTANHERKSKKDHHRWRQEDDYLRENLGNINSMLEAMASTPTDTPLDMKDNTRMRRIRNHLGKGIYNIHWVYRLVTRILILQQFHQQQGVTKDVILEALQQVSQGDRLWDQLSSSLENTRPQSPYLIAGLFGSPDGDRDMTTTKGPKSTSEDYTEHEKKLLSGLVDADEIKTTFDDVIAPPEISESLIALTSLSLRRPEAFSYGVLARERIHGCLLYGPPGTGKTLMAKAIAKNSGAKMLEVSAASINDMWVGNSEKNVRALFSLARKLSPVIIFLDEAESLLGSRSQRSLRGGYLETINQFLREWDGLTNSLNNAKTFVMVATNRPYDLDEAVLRRLPRRILVDLPIRHARLAILQSLLREETLDSSISLSKLASRTELYSGSDLKNLCVAAAMEAVKEQLRAEKEHGPSDPLKKRILTAAHFQRALNDITASISQDMESLKAIRKFDEQYGDGRRQRKQGLMGFEVVTRPPSSEEARIRKM